MRESSFLIAAGGTGGHVFPALEVARVLKTRGHSCRFVGTEKGIERRLVPQAGFPIDFIQIGTWQGSSLGRRLRTLLELPVSLLSVASILDGFRPAAVFSLGGYASGPVMLTAVLRDTPLIIMEPNAKPGLANRLAGPFASWALLGFPQAERFFPSGKAEFCGTPVREAFFRVPAKAHELPLTVLITGGSHGSRRLNRAAVEALPILERQGLLGQLRFLHQTGQADCEEVRQAYEARGVVARVAAFIDDMPGAFAEADFVICRAGASAVSELAAAGKASVLIPYPYAADQHQLRNAEAMQAAGAALVSLDSEWTGERLAEEVGRLIQAPAMIATMEEAARLRARPGAAQHAADVLERFAAHQAGQQKLSLPAQDTGSSCAN